MHDYIYGISDICFNRAVRQVHSTLQHTTGEAGQGLLCRSGMYCRETPGVTRVKKLEKIEGLASADFPELRGGFLCSWCELSDGYLSAVPHPKSKCEVLRFSYPREAEIVGRVVGVTMRFTEAGPGEG